MASVRAPPVGSSLDVVAAIAAEIKHDRRSRAVPRAVPRGAPLIVLTWA